MSKPVINAIEVFQTQNKLRMTAEMMLLLLLDLQTQSPENFAHLNNRLKERTDLNVYDLVNLTDALWNILK